MAGESLVGLPVGPLAVEPVSRHALVTVEPVKIMAAATLTFEPLTLNLDMAAKRRKKHKKLKFRVCNPNSLQEQNSIFLTFYEIVNLIP